MEHLQSIGHLWQYFFKSEVEDYDGMCFANDDDALVLTASIRLPGRMLEAHRRAQRIMDSGRDASTYIDAGNVEKVMAFGARCTEFAELAKPDLTAGGWSVSSHHIADSVFAYRTEGDCCLQGQYIKDLKDVDVVHAAVAFCEADFQPQFMDGLVQSACLARSEDAALWVQHRKYSEEVMQVEMVNALDLPLGAILHMSYSCSDTSFLFPDVTVPAEGGLKRTQGYKQAVTFEQLPHGGTRVHFGFSMEVDPRMLAAIAQLPPYNAASLLSKSFSTWPVNFQWFINGHHDLIIQREALSPHSCFYGVCRSVLVYKTMPHGQLAHVVAKERGLALDRVEQEPEAEAEVENEEDREREDKKGVKEQEEEDEEDIFYDAEEYIVKDEGVQNVWQVFKEGALRANREAKTSVSTTPTSNSSSPLSSPRSEPDTEHPVVKGLNEQPLQKSSVGLVEDQQRLFKEFIGSHVLQNVPGRNRRRPSTIGIEINAYSRLHVDDYNDLIEMESNEGWLHRTSTESGLEIYTKDVENMPCKCFKGIVRISTYGHGCRALIEAIKAHNVRMEWDDQCVYSKVVEEYPPFYSVGHYKFDSGAGMVSTREMVLLSRLFFEEDGSVLAAIRSIDEEGIPVDPDCIRCTMRRGGFIVRPVPDTNGDFTVMYVGCVEAGGWVPTFVQDMTAWRQPLALDKFKAWFEDGARQGGAALAAVCGAGQHTL